MSSRLPPVNLRAGWRSPIRATIFGHCSFIFPHPVILFRWEPLSQFSIFMPPKSISLQLFTAFQPQPLPGFLTPIHRDLLHKPLPPHTPYSGLWKHWAMKGWVFFCLLTIFVPGIFPDVGGLHPLK